MLHNVEECNQVPIDRLDREVSEVKSDVAEIKIEQVAQGVRLDEMNTKMDLCGVQISDGFIRVGEQIGSLQNVDDYHDQQIQKLWQRVRWQVAGWSTGWAILAQALIEWLGGSK